MASVTLTIEEEYDMVEFSVLMSVYHKEKPEFLRQSLDSIFSQTLPPTEVVLVQDGPVPEAIAQVMDEYQASHPEMKLIKLDKGCGLGGALNEGLKHCSYDIVARMDTDDISKPDRFKEQVTWLAEHPDVDVCGSWIDEFSGEVNNVVSSRKPPQEHADIVSFSHKRNPMNHPTVVFRRKAVERAGSYQPFHLFEDYYLWVRMIQTGCHFHNIQRSLLFFRMSPDMFLRRGGFKYSCTEIRFQKKLHKMGHIGWGTMMQNIIYRTTVRNLPNSIRKFIYVGLLRR